MVVLNRTDFFAQFSWMNEIESSQDTFLSFSLPRLRLIVYSTVAFTYRYNRYRIYRYLQSTSISHQVCGLIWNTRFNKTWNCQSTYFSTRGFTSCLVQHITTDAFKVSSRMRAFRAVEMIFRFGHWLQFMLAIFLSRYWVRQWQQLLLQIVSGREVGISLCPIDITLYRLAVATVTILHMHKISLSLARANIPYQFLGRLTNSPSPRCTPEETLFRDRIPRM